MACERSKKTIPENRLFARLPNSADKKNHGLYKRPYTALNYE